MKTYNLAVTNIHLTKHYHQFQFSSSITRRYNKPIPPATLRPLSVNLQTGNSDILISHDTCGAHIVHWFFSRPILLVLV